MFVRIAYYQIYAWERGEFFRGALGVAAGHDDTRFGILALHAANGGTGVLVGSCGHCAGIQDDYRSLIRTRGAGQALLFELAFQGSSVGLRRAAAEVFYVVSGHSSIVLETRSGRILEATVMRRAGWTDFNRQSHNCKFQIWRELRISSYILYD